MTPPRVRIIGIGQPAAGDDGVGPAVVEALRRGPLPDGVELRTARDASELLDFLEGCDRVVIVDASVGAETPGEVQVLEADQLRARISNPLSSHGLSIVEALDLSRALPAPRALDVRVVAVGINAPRRYKSGLTPEVRTAIPRASRLALELASSPAVRTVERT